MKGDMALDTMFKMVMVVVAVAILVGLFVHFGNKAKQKVTDVFGSGESSQPLLIEGFDFSPADVSKYVSLCAKKSAENPKNTMICYILKGDFPDGWDAGDFNDCDHFAGTLMVVYKPGRGVGVTC